MCVAFLVKHIPADHPLLFCKSPHVREREKGDLLLRNRHAFPIAHDCIGLSDDGKWIIGFTGNDRILTNNKNEQQLIHESERVHQ